MNRFGKLAGLLVAVALVASFSCFLSSRLWPHGNPRAVDSHRWVHRQLDLTPDQDKALDAQEEQFAARKEALRQAIEQANAELATAMQQDKEYSPRVIATVEKIHHAQSELEKATLEHIFAMKNVLTPAQFDRLLKLTGDALNEPGDF